MNCKSEAIVLHSLKYGDNHLVVDMFTRESGRMSFIVPLPKSARSRLKKQYFQPMTLLEVECDVRQNAQLQRLMDARLLRAYTGIPFSAEKLALTLFSAEFLYHALRSEQRNEPLFVYLRDAMLWLDVAPGSYANFHLTFLMRLTRFLGFYPNLEESGRSDASGVEGGGETLFFDLREGRFCTAVPLHRDYLTPAEARYIRLLMRMDFPTMHLFRLSRQQRNRIAEVLLRFYRLHIPQFPELRSLSVLQTLWA